MSEQSFYTNRGDEAGKGGETNKGGETRWFSFLYRTRVKVLKEDVTIINLSLAFTLLAVISAPWLAVAGLVIALVLGYRFCVEKNAKGFAGDFQEVVRDAAGNVKAAVNNVVKDDEE